MDRAIKPTINGVRSCETSRYRVPPRNASRKAYKNMSDKDYRSYIIVALNYARFIEYRVTDSP